MLGSRAGGRNEEEEGIVGYLRMKGGFWTVLPHPIWISFLQNLRQMNLAQVRCIDLNSLFTRGG